MQAPWGPRTFSYVTVLTVAQDSTNVNFYRTVSRLLYNSIETRRGERKKAKLKLGENPLKRTQSATETQVAPKDRSKSFLLNLFFFIFGTVMRAPMGYSPSQETAKNKPKKK